MSAMTETDSDDRTPPPTVWGTFQARDAHAMIDFLVKLGFEATAVYDDPDDPDIVQHSELNWPEGGGVMCGSNKSGSMAQEPGTAGFYVVTADPKAVHDRAVAAGAEITRELQLASLRRARVRAEGPRGQRLVLRQLPRGATHRLDARPRPWSGGPPWSGGQPDCYPTLGVWFRGAATPSSPETCARGHRPPRAHRMWWRDDRPGRGGEAEGGEVEPDEESGDPTARPSETPSEQPVSADADALPPVRDKVVPARR